MAEKVQKFTIISWINSQTCPKEKPTGFVNRFNWIIEKIRITRTIRLQIGQRFRLVGQNNVERMGKSNTISIILLVSHRTLQIRGTDSAWSRTWGVTSWNHKSFESVLQFPAPAVQPHVQICKQHLPSTLRPAGNFPSERRLDALYMSSRGKWLVQLAARSYRS